MSTAGGFDGGPGDSAFFVVAGLALAMTFMFLVAVIA